MPGRYYDQWTIGDRIAHQPHRTVTETDNLLVSALTHNPQPLHLDAEYAAGTEFGRIVVNGTFTFALLVGLSVGDTTLGTLVANLGYDKVTMPTRLKAPRPPMTTPYWSSPAARPSPSPCRAPAAARRAAWRAMVLWYRRCRAASSRSTRGRAIP
jgi:acyl dehydratase